jgi:hypothetical protein
MHLKQSETLTHVPGHSTPTVRVDTEWVCPDCDYFEEAEDSGT